MFHTTFGKNRGSGGKNLEKDVMKWYDSQIQDPKLREKMIPNYEIGCKRITPSDTYLKVRTTFYLEKSMM